MSDAREEAAIARDALVRDKKKPKHCWDLAYQLQIEVDEKGKVEVRPL